VSERISRLALQIRRELSELVAREVKDPRVQEASLVTVTHVRLADDLGVADVLVSVVGGDGAAVVKALGRAAGFLRGELGRRLRTKKIPTLRFHIDQTEDQAEKIDALLKEIHDEDARRT